MAIQECPKCGTKFSDSSSSSEGWAESALSTLVMAPAIKDMGTQVRCPKCQHLFADGEIRYLRSYRSKGIWLLVLAVLAWAVYELFRL